MNSRIRRRVYSCVWATVMVAGSTGSARAADATIKVAFWNVRSGQGISALTGYAAPFVDSPNCTDPTKPLNAWGVGAMQAQLHAALDDPSALALGVTEAWSCASPERIRQALGWKSATAERNGVALLARHGFAAAAQWQQLDTSLNPNPADTMWVLRAPVCIDSACTRSMPVYVAHWYATDANQATTLARQAEQTVAFLKATAGGQPHVFLGDLNVFEGSSLVCEQAPNNTTLTYLRNAAYLDAWTTVHGAAEGYTGMVNRNGCGYPVGYAWKRIDYAWTQPTYQPVDIRRFGMVNPGDASPSDHYGLVVTLPHPYPAAAPEPGPDPAPTPVPTPAPSGTGDIVLYAKSATVIGGAWSRVDDATAAGGVRLANPDQRLPKLGAPMAAPISYFDIPFKAETGRAYRLWIRSRAQNDAWTNDSVFVQFSGSRGTDGAPIYRMGTTTAAIYSLEEDTGLGESGWGWQDTGYGINVAGAPIYFDAAAQTIRIQSREDGISIDQIVLSPLKYASAAPGAARDDATILTETSAAAPPTAAGWTSLVKAIASGATIQKNSGCGDCPDAGGVSLPSSASSPAVSFTVNAGHRLLAGLGRQGGPITSYTAIDYAFSFSAGARWEIREAGIYRHEGPFAPSDDFRIAVEGGAVKYFRNGALVYISKVPVAAPLVIDATLVSIGAAVTLK
jgi:hypothetical protein